MQGAHTGKTRNAATPGSQGAPAHTVKLLQADGRGVALVCANEFAALVFPADLIAAGRLLPRDTDTVAHVWLEEMLRCDQDTRVAPGIRAARR